jgi:SWI/SNF-related matrix-associated actin-dependent regulator 1 of chromatin subfamily A
LAGTAVELSSAEMNAQRSAEVCATSTLELEEAVAGIRDWHSTGPVVAARLAAALESSSRLLDAQSGQSSSAAAAAPTQHALLIADAKACLSAIQQQQKRQGWNQPFERLVQSCQQLTARTVCAAAAVRTGMNSGCPLMQLLEHDDVRALILSPKNMGLVASGRLCRVSRSLRTWVEAAMTPTRLTVIGTGKDTNVVQVALHTMALTELPPLPDRRANSRACLMTAAHGSEPGPSVLLMGGSRYSAQRGTTQYYGHSALLKTASTDWSSVTIKKRKGANVFGSGITAGLQGFGTARLPESRVMIAGGVIGQTRTPSVQYQKKVFRYDLATQTWSELPEMATARQNMAIATLPDGRIIVAGGRVSPSSGSYYHREGYSCKAEIFDPATNSWTQLPDLEDSVCCGTVTADGRFVAVTNRGSTHTYNITRNSWTCEHMSTSDKSFMRMSWYGEDAIQLTSIGNDIVAVGQCSRNWRKMQASVCDGSSWRRLPIDFGDLKPEDGSGLAFVETLTLSSTAAAALLTADMSSFQKLSQTLSFSPLMAARATAFNIGVCIKQPPNVGGTELKLMSHQTVGLNFVNLLHRNRLSGVLNDEMGLGKTIQVIAFLGHLRHCGDLRPNLIVAPPSVLENWERELEKWLPTASIVRYWGTDTERQHMRANYRNLKAPVVLLTSYSLFEGHKSADMHNFLKCLSFATCVLDEAQLLRNPKSQRVLNLLGIECTSRLLLTGTAGRHLDLPCLAHLVLPSSFTPAKTAIESNDIDSLKGLLSPLFLRRLQLEVIAQDCTIWFSTELVQMTSQQSQIYQHIIQQHRPGNGTTQSEGQLQSPSAQGRQTFFNELRKAASHPMLLKGSTRNGFSDSALQAIISYAHDNNVYGSQASREQVQTEVLSLSGVELHVLCSEFAELEKYCVAQRTICGQSAKFRWLRQRLPKLHRDGHRMLIFAQTSDALDLLEFLCLETKLDYCRMDGRTPVAERQGLVDTFNGHGMESSDIPVFLLSTRAAVGINLATADTAIFYDQDTNPANDSQALGRCYRLGQTRNVTVYRLVTENTVESTVAEIMKREEHARQLRRGISNRKAAGGGDLHDHGNVAMKDIVTEALAHVSGSAQV